MTRYAVVLSGPRLRRILHATDFALRAVVKAAAHRHDMRVTGFLDGFGGLLADQARPLAFDDRLHTTAASHHRVMVVEVTSTS